MSERIEADIVIASDGSVTGSPEAIADLQAFCAARGYLLNTFAYAEVAEEE